MSANQETDLAQLHDIIVATLQAQFPALQTVEFYRTDRESLPVPACLLDLSEMEADPDEDPGTGQIAMRMRFEAELVLTFRTEAGKLAVRQQAAAFAAFLRKRSRWPGIPQAGAMEVLGAYKSDFQPELDQYEVWRVEWRQLLHLGQSVWSEDGTPTPTEVWLGQYPEIGPGHEPDYTQIAGQVEITG